MRSQLKNITGKIICPTGISTMVPWNWEPVCYQWANLTSLFTWNINKLTNTYLCRIKKVNKVPISAHGIMGHIVGVFKHKTFRASEWHIIQLKYVKIFIIINLFSFTKIKLNCIFNALRNFSKSQMNWSQGQGNHSASLIHWLGTYS